MLSLLFSDLGIPFVAGATVDIALTRERFRRACTSIALPTAMFDASGISIWGHEAHDVHLPRQLPHRARLHARRLLGEHVGAARVLDSVAMSSRSRRSTGAVPCWSWRSASAPGASTGSGAYPGDSGPCWWSGPGSGSWPVSTRRRSALRTVGRYQYMGADLHPPDRGRAAARRASYESPAHRRRRAGRAAGGARATSTAISTRPPADWPRSPSARAGAWPRSS